MTDDSGAPPPRTWSWQPDQGAVRSLEVLLRRALTDCHTVDAQLSQQTHATSVNTLALVEVLLESGLIEREAFEAARARLAAQLARVRSAEWRGPTLFPSAPERPRDTPPGAESDGAEATRSPDDVIVDCDARRPKCQSACCAIYNVHLTAEEVRAGELLWDIADPYRIVRRNTGRCMYLDERTLKCSIWERRPAVCRQYTCKGNPDIWQDFDAMTITDKLAATLRQIQIRETLPPR